MERMRARPNSSFVMIGICQPSIERALMPESLSNMLKSAIEACSPVESRLSTSARSGSAAQRVDRSSSLLVFPDLAESTTTTLYP